MGIRDLRRALKGIDTGTPISVGYLSRKGYDEAIGRYNGENGYRLFLRFGQKQDAPAGSGHVALGSVSSVYAFNVRRRQVYTK